MLSNITTPSTTMWKADPTERGTFSLLWSCIFTLIICGWTSLHLNVPAHPQRRKLFCKRLLGCVVALLAPDLLAIEAYVQYREAARLRKTIMGSANAHKVVPLWTMKHAHYACMGGLAFEFKGELRFRFTRPVTPSYRIAIDILKLT